VAHSEAFGFGPGRDTGTPLGRSKKREVGGRVAAQQFRHHGFAVLKTDDDVLVPFQHVMGRHDQPLSVPDDAGDRQAFAPFHPDQSIGSRRNGIG
jgi:hypothetical protein